MEPARLFVRGLVLMLFSAALALTNGQARAEERTTGKDAEDILAAVVKVRMKALADARTKPFLGGEREGTGIVIDNRGHVLTIGYVVIEADSIEITTAEGKTVPGTLAGYDHATGFALLRPAVPIDVKPVSLGKSADVGERDPVLIVPYGGRDEAKLAIVASRREFTGNWEYLLDSAIFTTPPILNWAGSALIDRQGKLVGVGSLFVRNSLEAERPIPGNVFVPIDLLKPILPDLIDKGRAKGPARPWLGLATEEVQGHLFVSRVSPGGPADKAGVRTGDVVIAVAGEAVGSHGDFYRRVWALGPAGTDVPLNVLQGAKLNDLSVHSIDRVEYLRTKPTY